MTIQGKIEGVETVQAAIRKVPKRVMTESRRIFAQHVVILRSHIREDYLTGGTGPARLAVRTGNLRSSTRELPVTDRGDSIESGVGFGTSYAQVHVGPKGQVTTIRAKKGKFLAIPLRAARTPAGVGRGAPRSGVFGETFIRRTEAGKLMIFGRRVVQRGQNAGATRGGIVPLFLLVKQVAVPARVHPEDILAWSKEKLIQEYGRIGVKIGG